MNTLEQKKLNIRIKEYLLTKVREAFPDDYYLIEESVNVMVERYSLKELIIYARLEIQRLRNMPERKFGSRDLR